MALKLTPKQKIAIKELGYLKYLEILFDGGSRAGKTFIILMHIINCCLIFDNIRCLVARQVFAHAKASLWIQTLLPMLKLYYKGLFTINNSGYIISFNNGSEIWLGGLDDKERTDKILGQEYAIIFFNEAVQKSLKTVDVVKTRLAQKIKGLLNHVIYDCNPRSPAHWLFKKFYINKTDELYQLHWLPEDNIGNIADNYIENVLDRLSESEKQRFRYGKWVNIEGAVYKLKEENFLDTVKDWNFYDDIVAGCDFGYNSALDIWGIKENKAYNLYSFTLIDKTTKDIIKCLDSVYYMKKYQYTIYCDHELDRIKEICDNGYNAKLANKEVGAGDSSVNTYELYFDHKSGETFQSMVNLMHDQDKFGNYTEKHIKENDHHADASRYALHSWTINNYAGEAHFFIRNK